MIINFDYNKFDITPESKTILTDNAQQLLEFSDVNLQIEGHCDERGTEQYNLSLGQRRADAVRNFLVNYGVGDARISVISYGEEKPLCREISEGCWARNRRAEFIIKE